MKKEKNPQLVIIGELTIQRLSWQNWLRLLTRRQLKDLTVTVNLPRENK